MPQSRLKKPQIRENPDERRRQLVQAGIRCLAKYGHANSSVRQICREAKVSPGLLGHYFETKHDLILECFRTVAFAMHEKLDQVIEEAGSDPDAQMEAFIHASFSDEIVDPTSLHVWICFWSLVQTDEAIKSLHQENYQLYRKRLESLLDAIAKKHKFEADTYRSAVLFSAVMDGLWLEYCLDHASFSAEEGIDYCLVWMKSFVEKGALRFT